MAFQVQFKDAYPFESQVSKLIRQVLIEHPLRRDTLSLQDIDSITITINLWTDMVRSRYPPEIDYRKFPKVTLHFGLHMYQDTNTDFKDALFKKDMFHEFTHLIDSRNPAFRFTFRKKEMALKLERPYQTNLGCWSVLKHIWNCYIDGRLRRRGICVKTWEERYDQIGERRRCRLGNEAVSIFRIAYEQDTLSFDCLLSLQKQCLKHYQTHQNA